MTNQAFSGFSQSALDFLKKLAKNNNREWFAKHKEIYTNQVLVPMKTLVTALNPMMEELDRQVVTNPARAVSRIYRDTRFATDKSPYKTCMWFVYRRNVERWSETPAYFFELKANEYSYGMGFYMAPRATMDRFREMIDADPEKFRETIAFSKRSRTLKLVTEDYKRPIPCPHEEDIRPWYQCKTFAVMATKEPDKTLFSKKMVDLLLESFVQLKPLHDYLWQAVAKGRQ